MLTRINKLLGRPRIMSRLPAKFTSKLLVTLLGATVFVLVKNAFYSGPAYTISDLVVTQRHLANFHEKMTELTLHQARIYDNYIDTKKKGRCSQYNQSANLERPFFEDILGSRATICKDNTQITYVTQLTLGRWSCLKLVLDNWEGPVSAAVYVHANHSSVLYNSTVALPPEQRHRLMLHVVPQYGELYPVNFLRNIALNASCTRYVLLSDIDFIPAPGSHGQLLKQASLQHGLSQHQVLVVPAFEEVKNESIKIPASKKELLRLWEAGAVRPFRYGGWFAGHKPTNYTKWRESSQPYEVLWRDGYEPYIVAERTSIPAYSQRFVERYGNKIEHILHLTAMGFRFTVDPDAFLLHKWHPMWKKPATDAMVLHCSYQLILDFRKVLRKDYNFIFH